MWSNDGQQACYKLGKKLFIDDQKAAPWFFVFLLVVCLTSTKNRAAMQPADVDPPDSEPADDWGLVEPPRKVKNKKSQKAGGAESSHPWTLDMSSSIDRDNLW